ncbi:hypothetical protein D3C84_679030 [compost metagenome]
MVKTLGTVAHLVEVEDDELVRVLIKKRGCRVDQLIKDTMRLKAIVMKVEDRLIAPLGVTKSDIKCPCTIGQLPRK